MANLYLIKKKYIFMRIVYDIIIKTHFLRIKLIGMT